MADFTVFNFCSIPSYGITYAEPYNVDVQIMYIPTLISAEIGALQSYTYYLMRWQDVDCLPTVTYRVWTSVDSPDPTGIYYTGTKCGATPITGAIIAATWTEQG